MIFRPAFPLALAVALLAAAAPSLPLSGHGWIGAAWADDDDDGGWDDDDDDDGGRDDDDDDDDDDDGGRSAAPVAPPPAPSPPPPLSAPDEIVALALSEADLAILTAQGFQVVEEVAVPAFAATARRLRIPPGTALATARQTVRALATGGDADFNHYYRYEQGFPADCRDLECPARHIVDWPELPRRETACGRTVAVGMIDTGINDAHEAFSGARLEVRRLAAGDFAPSRAVHGTAVAALLVGDPATRSPGLVPGSRLVAVDAFHLQGTDERADAFALVEALGFLAEEGVRVINLSLAGPPNTVLEDVVGRLTGDLDVVVVAAVGNDGPRAAPAYPAAYPSVIGVTAVDRDGTVYRRATQGTHVDLAAPGVAVWTAASISGARWKTGTSFAAPFVSAAAAILREARPELPAREIGEELRRLATDLGDPGPDPAYGAGLVGLGQLCSDAA